MTVTIHSTAGASGSLCPYVLGNGILESPSGLDSGGQKQVQVSPVFRGTPRVFDRLNQHRQVVFSVFREHGSLDAAALFQLTHADDAMLKSVDYVVFAVGTTNKKLENAVFHTPSVTLKGRTTTTRYTVVGTGFAAA